MGNEPVDVEGGVIEADAAIGGGMIIVVALVSEDGVLAEDYKSVCKASWYPELTFVLS